MALSGYSPEPFRRSISAMTVARMRSFAVPLSSVAVVDAGFALEAGQWAARRSRRRICSR